jgi:phage shock protein PspC (stress-responsive transcriptional regulator)
MKKFSICLLSLSMQTSIVCASNSTINTTTHKEFKVSEDNKVIGGVCGGLGEYFDIDPDKIRIGFVVFSLLGGSGILVYLILWIIMS